MLIADLSIDFDFFTRELEAWEFDCDETPFHAQEAWKGRYGRVDLHAETCIDRYADFAPERIVEALRSKGIGLLPGALRRRVGIADSHAHALGFLRASSRIPPMLINLDAHHDLFSSTADVNCGNWAVHALGLRPDLRFVQVYPSWKDPKEDSTPCRDVELVRWNEWAGFSAEENVQVRHIFLCRSAGWVPPHHDRRFFETADVLGRLGRVEWMETMEARKLPELVSREPVHSRASSWDQARQSRPTGLRPSRRS